MLLPYSACESQHNLGFHPEIGPRYFSSVKIQSSRNLPRMDNGIIFSTGIGLTGISNGTECFSFVSLSYWSSMTFEIIYTNWILMESKYHAVRCKSTLYEELASLPFLRKANIANSYSIFSYYGTISAIELWWHSG